MSRNFNYSALSGLLVTYLPNPQGVAPGCNIYPFQGKKKSKNDGLKNNYIYVVKKMNICDSVIISSFEWKMIEDISSMDGAPAVGLISRDPTNTINRDLCDRLKVFSWHPNFNGLGCEQVEMMHGMGIKVFPYNVESLEQYEEAAKMEVDGVITSDPVLMNKSVIQAGEWVND